MLRTRKSSQCSIFIGPLILALPFLILLGACSSLSTVDHLYANETKKKGMLGEQVAKYHKALYWGAFDEASLYMLPETQTKVRQDLKNSLRGHRMVDIVIDDVSFDFNEEKDEAKVQVLIRSYRKPMYVVKTRKDEETWIFSRLDGGWLLSGVQTVEADIPTPAGQGIQIGRGIQ